jgi:hypothetical protein
VLVLHRRTRTRWLPVNDVMAVVTFSSQSPPTFSSWLAKYAVKDPEYSSRSPLLLRRNPGMEPKPPKTG